MARRSVQLRTPVPSLAEVGERLGLTKARQKKLASIIEADPSITVRERRNGSGLAQKRATAKLSSVRSTSSLVQKRIPAKAIGKSSSSRKASTVAGTH